MTGLQESLYLSWDLPFCQYLPSLVERLQKRDSCRILCWIDCPNFLCTAIGNLSVSYSWTFREAAVVTSKKSSPFTFQPAIGNVVPGNRNLFLVDTETVSLSITILNVIPFLLTAVIETSCTRMLSSYDLKFSKNKPGFLSFTWKVLYLVVQVLS